MKRRANLCAIYELRERDIGVMPERMEELPVLRVGSAILELEPQEVAQVRRGSAAELNCQGRAEVRYYHHCK